MSYSSAPADHTAAEHLAPGKMFDLTGKIALITGGATGIGLMQARGLRAAGAKVYIVGRRGEVLEQTAKVHGSDDRPLIPLTADISTKEGCLSLADEFSKHESKLDILISNAGVVGPLNEGSNTADASLKMHPEHREQRLSIEEFAKKSLEDNSPDDWDSLFRINVYALYFLSLAFLPLLAKGTEASTAWSSTIITTGSISGVVKQSQLHVSYNASKAAVHHVTKMLAFEVAAATTAKVRINAIAPGTFPSQMTAKDKNDDTSISTLKGKMDEMALPAGRPGREEDMVQATQFLASCQYLNGQILCVDGGFTLTEP
ncbi:Short-chain dehydrogenase/reductase, conserved site [Kalmanozyma brasiliensis GHG001]|uniref:Short-chain dehydrogenase/reductase, conserved site n=1 Tax=Kalmanozyma brasiliensis (strain GHG001) TaxID=1365824 RepID=UPI001CEA2E4B|nr:Short-chain dehydrogenase/reductase, conserved site [Kalmanozyma brasiliensis GHG001]EST08392.2 Short-chain dehydrogenase/reductase, conserved site [Kalmanozyma brasiliensis GHG001]